MLIQPNENVRGYLLNEASVPLIKHKGSLWYSITQAEKDSLAAVIHALLSIPQNEFEALSDSEKWDLSCMLNDAERIYKNCIIRG